MSEICMSIALCMYIHILVLLYVHTYLIYFGTNDSTDIPGNQMLNEDVACRSNECLLCVLYYAYVQCMYI